MQDRLFRKSVRVVIPFKDDETNEFIEIRNPDNHLSKKIRQRLVDRINGKDEFTNNEILEYLISELTNVKLNMTLEQLLEEDMSFECKMLLFHITEIYDEIQTEMLYMMKMDIMAKKNKNLEEEFVSELKQVK